MTEDHNAHDVAEAMFKAKQKKLEERRCPPKYCSHEFKEQEAHPRQ